MASKEEARKRQRHIRPAFTPAPGFLFTIYLYLELFFCSSFYIPLCCYPTDQSVEEIVSSWALLDEVEVERRSVFCVYVFIKALYLPLVASSNRSSLGRRKFLCSTATLTSLWKHSPSEQQACTAALLLFGSIAMLLLLGLIACCSIAQFLACLLN